jgi:hypothetical protein
VINILGNNYQVECSAKRHLRKLYTRDSKKLMPPVFYFMLFPSWTCETFTELHYSIAEGIVIFQCRLHLYWPSSSTFEHEHEFLRVNVAGCSLQPLVNGILQCLVISKDQIGDNLILQGQGCMVDAATISIQNLWWSLFWDETGIIVNVLPRGTTVNSDTVLKH